ncbi:MAG TPA: amidohydrolase family protein [Vicinamibacterales bacterium]|nr:amidohydrolase family protein [Vicinamibacterales bacterium]
MRREKLLVCGLSVLLGAVIAGCSSQRASEPPAASAATVFEGARLITGDGGAPLENSAFVVEGNRFTAVGRNGELQAPAGATRVDLTGKTVMPAIIDAHGHLGFLDMANGTMSKANFTRENYIDHLQRYAYHGVAATISTGTDMGELAYELRDEIIPDAAIIRTVGRGLAWPGSGPNDPSRNDVPYAVTNVEQARKAVQDLAAHKPDFVKIWVDDRNGRQKKLTPEIYQAAVDEAHKHNLRAIAHVFELEDAKGLVRAGVEGFLHSIRDAPVDDEFITLAKEHNIWITPNLGGINRASLIGPAGTPAWFDDPLVRETIAPVMINARTEMYEKRRTAGAPAAGAQVFDLANTRKLHAAGVRLVLGSDTAGDANRWIGMMTLVEFENMVAAGLTPAEVIVAATRDAAAVLRLDQLGTVASGKSADFIVLDANPLDNIANVRKIARVYLRGQEVDRAGLRARWQARWGKATPTH